MPKLSWKQSVTLFHANRAGGAAGEFNYPSKSSVIYIAIYFACILLLFPIEYIESNFSSIGFAASISRLMLLFVLVVALLKSQIRLTGYFVACCLLFVELLAVTYLNGQNISYCFNSVIRIATVILLIMHGLQKRSNEFVIAGALAFNAEALANTFSIILYPNALGLDAYNGEATRWLLGGDNGSLPIYVYAVLFSFLMAKPGLFGDSIVRFVPLANLCFFIFVRDIATGIACFGIALCFYVFSRVSRRDYALHVVMFSVLVFVLIVLLRMQDSLGWLVSDYLHRDLTFSGRTNNWDMTLLLIEGSPIFGYGWISFTNYIASFGLVFGGANVHNMFLLIVFSGGWVALVLLGVCLACALKGYGRFELRRCYPIISAAFLFVLIRSQFEPGFVTVCSVFFLLAIMDNLRYSSLGRSSFVRSFSSEDKNG